MKKAEFKVILFIIEKDFSKSHDIEIRLNAGKDTLIDNYNDIEKYLKNTLKKDFRIIQIEKI